MRTLLRLCCLVFVILLSGCDWLGSSTRGSLPDGKGGIGAHLISLGDYCLWIGAAGLGVGIALSLAGVGIAFARYAFSIGAAGIAVGAALLWLGEYPWLLGVAFVLTAVAFALHHRTDIRRWLRIKSVPTPEVDKS